MSKPFDNCGKLCYTGAAVVFIGFLHIPFSYHNRQHASCIHLAGYTATCEGGDRPNTVVPC